MIFIKDIICHVNEVAFGTYVKWGLEFIVPLSPQPKLTRRRKDLEADYRHHRPMLWLINHAYITKPPQNPQRREIEKPPGWEHMETCEERHAQIGYVALCIYSIWLFLSYIHL